MQYDREAGKSFGYLVQNVKTKLRLLTGFELICAVACSDSDCQGIHACAGHELFYFIRLCVSSICIGYVDCILDTSQSSKLCLYHNASLMGILYDFLRQLDVGLEIVMRTVDHNGSKSAVDTGFADLEISAVIQMKRDGKVRSFHKNSLNQLHQIVMLCVLSCACGYL